MKYWYVIFLIFIIYSCNSGISEETSKQINNELEVWKGNIQNLTNLSNEIESNDTILKKMLSDSLGEAGIKFIEKDSLSRERIKSLNNDYQNLKTDYSNLLANYNTLLKETQDWSKNIAKSNQSSDEINEEWESKQRQIQEILSQKEAYQQAFNSLKMSYQQAISEIKTKMNKK